MIKFLKKQESVTPSLKMPETPKSKSKKIKKFLIAYVVCFLVLFVCVQAHATTVGEDGDEGTTPNTIGLTINTNNDEGALAGTLQMLLVITVISLAPSILVMMTSFTRIIVVLHFLRTALGTQTAPPNNVLIGLSLFLTLFIMAPVFTKVNEEGIKPLSEGEITQEEAYDACMKPMREFMLKQVKDDDLRLFMDMANIDSIESVDELPDSVIIPSFIVSELRAGFIIGFVIYIPFIVIDMVVASTLMSMGMMMLPPTTISMPFKILLFILADGWNLVVEQVVNSFVM